MLLGLAIYNGVLLDVHFPAFAYKRLLGLPVGFTDLRAAAPELGRGLDKLLSYPGSDVEDVFCLSFTADLEAFGEVGWTKLLFVTNCVPLIALPYFLCL